LRHPAACFFAETAHVYSSALAEPPVIDTTEVYADPLTPHNNTFVKPFGVIPEYERESTFESENVKDKVGMLCIGTGK
jgi:hypothetical protein